MHRGIVKGKFGLVSTTALQVIYSRVNHDTSDPRSYFTLEFELMQVLEHFDKSFLQYVFGISHGFSIAIAHTHHHSRIFRIQVMLCLTLSLKTSFYQLMVIHSKYLPYC